MNDKPAADTNEERSRFGEIVSVLRKHKITKGISPKTLREIIEELGPTFIKLGQIMSMRPDLIPKEYCEELQKLRSNVKPMPYEEVKHILDTVYGMDINLIFTRFEESPLGSASIAQVHEAVLADGSHVVVKVQRSGIKKLMERDIALIRRLLKLIPSMFRGLTDYDRVLDEFWETAKEEMNFLKEADNIRHFAGLNEDVAFVGFPKVYSEYSSETVLVMEYIEGIRIDDCKSLEEGGYDLREVGEKLADNYVKQIMEDGYFHADPHPGNVCVRGGKIVWLDMGMMGRLTEKDRRLIARAVKAIARNNIGELTDVIVALGIFRGKLDRIHLYADIDALMLKYGNADIGSINIGELMAQLIDIMNANKISMPAELTMLARGMNAVEGVLAVLCPEVNIVTIASSRMSQLFLKNINLKEELRNEGERAYRSFQRALDIPVVIADILQSYRNNETRIKLDLHATEDLSKMLNALVDKLIIGIVIAALLIGSSIVSTTGMKPMILGIPLLGMCGYVVAFSAAVYMLIRHLRKKYKKK